VTAPRSPRAPAPRLGPPRARPRALARVLRLALRLALLSTPLLAPLAGCRRAPPPKAPPPPAPTIRDPGGIGARAFERMKEIAGNWLAGDLPVTFEVIERGNAIVQRGGLFAVWYPDGNTLAAMVFAEDGYHVRMRSTSITDGPGGELRVELAAFDSGNIVPDAPIARSLAMTIAPDHGGVTQRWSFGTNLDAPPRELVLTRPEAAAPAPKAPAPPPEAAPTPPPTP
jgi:hypothetical protein